jgi:hypothetical protein
MVLLAREVRFTAYSSWAIAVQLWEILNESLPMSVFILGSVTLMAPVPALNFAALLKNIPPGAWVALSSDKSRVVAYGADMRKVLEDARSAGNEDPIITRIPECPLALVL